MITTLIRRKNISLASSCLPSTNLFQFLSLNITLLSGNQITSSINQNKKRFTNPTIRKSTHIHNQKKKKKSVQLIEAVVRKRALLKH